MKFCFFIFLLIISKQSFSQSKLKTFIDTQHPILAGNFQHGNIIPTTDFVKGDNLIGKPLDTYEAYTVKLLWQNPGYTDWQKVYRGPYYGGGFSYNQFFNEEEIGNPVSVYGILGIPVIRFKKLELYSEFQFGMAFNWEKYDSIYNPKNLVIGGSMTIHLNIGLNAFYPITKNLDLGAGFNFVHFSNGGFERPNRGFNIYSPSVELRYHLFNRPDVRSIKSPGKLGRSNELYLMMGYGDHQLNEHELDTNYFAIGGITAIYFTQLANAFRIGGGTDLNYWWGLNANPDGTIGPRTAENFTIGFIVQPEFMIDKLTLVGGFGIYALHLDYGDFNQTYQRLGVRYEFYDNISFGVNVRAINFMLAEFLEFNLGYTFKWEK